MANNDYRRSELDKVDANGEYPAKLKIASDDGDTKWLDITPTEFEQIKNVLLDYRNDGDEDGTEAVEDPYPPAYHWLGWESEADFEPGRPDTYFLTICHPDGEEYAVIIHRTVDGQFPLDGDVAKRKEADAQRLVDALNRQ